MDTQAVTSPILYPSQGTTSNEPPDYENEQVFQRNRLPTRAYWIPETSILLNGEWDFHYAQDPLHAPQPTVSHNTTPNTSSRSSWVTSDLSLEEAEDETVYEWKKISVPGHWQLANAGFGRPQYTNVIYPFPVCPPHVPTANPTGTYRRQFLISKAWAKDSQLRLRFEGVDSAYHVWVNGHFVGYHQGSRNPGEFDITSVVEREGQNELFVRVYQWCDGSYIEDQDQWWLSGIFRDVYILAFPGKSRIDDYTIKTTFDHSMQDASLELSVDVFTSDPVQLHVTLCDSSDGDLVLASEKHSISTTSTANLKIAVKAPRKWTAETPYLYDLSMSISSKLSSDENIQTIKTKVGFRQVEIKNGQLLVNGRRIVLQGVNRHDHHLKFGRAVPLPSIHQDLLLMKQHNINAIRCSHYPPNPKMLELCDELGFWVIDEADLECHGFYDAVARPLNIPEEMDYEERKKLTFPQAAEYTSNNPKWRQQYLDRIQNVVQRDKNHPSVIIWSLGNEAFYGCNHKSMYDYVKKVDPTRPVHYEGDSKAVTTDMYSYMYPSTEKLIELSQTEGVVDGKYSKPIILCEYAHAMGNGPGNLQGYQDVFRKHPRVQGGFIWEWANHGLLKCFRRNWVGYGGDFNDFPNDGTFVMDGLCFSDHTPTPGLTEYKKVIAPIKVSRKDSKAHTSKMVELLVENHYDFIDLDHLAVTFRIEALEKSSPVILRAGAIELPHIPTGTSQVVKVPLENIKHVKDAEVWLNVSLRLKQATNWADAGHEIAWSQHRLDVERPFGSITKPLHSSGELQLKSTRTQWTISNNLFEIVFDRSSGGISSWKSGPQTLLLSDITYKNAISPGFWRAPTDNDRPRNNPYWKNFGVDTMTTQVRSLSINRTASGEFEIKSHTFLSPPILDWGVESHITYRIRGNQTIQINAKLTPTGKKPQYLPRIGLDVRVTKDLSTAAYFGLGPGESYPDKQDSQMVGLYRSSARDLFTNYEVPQESGNRMKARYVRLLHEQTSTGIEAVRNDATFSWALNRYTPQALEKAKHPIPRELREDYLLTLRLDVAVAGVGTGACGPDVLPQHQVKCEEVEFQFELRGISEISL